jgi:hypothetical protein
MVDASLPPIATPRDWRRPFARRYLLVAAILMLIALNLSVVASDYRQRKCDSPIGKVAVALKMDSYYSNCHCMKHSLDFSDPCNSIYVPLLI